MELFMNGLLNALICVVLMVVFGVIGVIQAFFERKISPKRIGETRWEVLVRGVRFGLWYGTAVALFVGSGLGRPPFPDPKLYDPDTIEIARLLGGAIGILIFWPLRFLPSKR